MNNSVYEINKGINRDIEFRGLKAQYIAYVAVGLVALLIIFAVLYICGVSLWIILPVIGGAGTMLVTTVYRMSHKYGRYGLMKKQAAAKLPVQIRNSSRKSFLRLNTKQTQP